MPPDERFSEGTVRPVPDSVVRSSVALDDTASPLAVEMPPAPLKASTPPATDVMPV